MSSAFPYEAIRSLIASLSAFPSSNVVYATEPDPFIAPKFGVVQGKIILNVYARSSVGNDEVRRTYAGNAQTEEWGGQRAPKMSIRVESHDRTTLASDVLESVRLKLNFQSSLDAAHAVGLAITDTSSVTTIPNFVQDEREVSAASLDVSFNQVVSLVNASPPGWIEKVSSRTRHHRP